MNKDMGERAEDESEVRTNREEEWSTESQMSGMWKFDEDIDEQCIANGLMKVK